MSETSDNTIHVDESELRREQPEPGAPADDPMQRLYDDLRPAVDALAARAQEAARRYNAAAGDAGERLRQQARIYADRTSAYVVEQPLKALTMAAAAGAAFALLMGGRRRH